MFFRSPVQAIPTGRDRPALARGAMIGVLSPRGLADPAGAHSRFFTVIMIPLSIDPKRPGLRDYSPCRSEARARQAKRGDWVVSLLDVRCVARFIYLA